MNSTEARALLRETVVMWDDNPDDAGVVREVWHGNAYHQGAVYIEWANGKRGWIRCQDMGRVRLWYPKEVRHGKECDNGKASTRDYPGGGP